MHIWYLYTQAALQLLQVDDCDLTKSFEYFLCAGDELGTELANILECGHRISNNSQGIGWFTKTHKYIAYLNNINNYTKVQIFNNGNTACKQIY